MRKWGRTAAVLLVLLAARVEAQVATGMIVGTVKDSGGPVPGAQVTAINLGTEFSRSTTTDASGEYALRLLPLGSYRLEVAKAGFKTFAQTGIVIEVGRSARIDPAIELGAVTEAIEVVGNAPLVETTTGSLSRVVNQKEVLNLPLVNRDLYSLLSLTGGISSNESGNSLGNPEQLTTVNGSSRAQMGSVNFLLDGGNNTGGLRDTGNAAPNPEAVQEFRVVTNGYAAEYGRYAAGVVDVITKSGTNDFHGSAFEFLRDDDLNAKRWVPPGQTATKDPLQRNQFGASVGGPIAKDKTFFFASYSGLRQEETQFRNSAVVPTAAERLGDFSQSAKKPNDPLTKAPFPGGIIPRSRLDPAAQQILGRFIPESNLPGNFYQVSEPDPLDTDEMTLKVDHAVSPAHQLALSYFYQKGTDLQPFSTNGNISWVDREFRWTQHNLNLTHTWTVSPTLINQLRATYMRAFGARVNSPETTLGDLGAKFPVQGPGTLPRITVNGYFTGQVQIAGPDAGSNYYGLKDSLSLSRGKHSFKVGGEASYEKIVHDTLLDNYGVFGFDGTKTGNALADFMLGLPASMSQDAPIRKLDNGAYLSLFAQDDFRLHPRVTLNLGLRYDLQFPFTDPQNRQLAFVEGAQSVISPTAPKGLLFPGDPGIGRGIAHTDTNNLAPRLAAAWDVQGDGKTSVRAAWGKFFGSITGNEWNTTADNQPFTIRQSFPNVKTLSDPYGNFANGASPYPYVYDPANPKFLLPAAVFGPSLDFVWPYTYQMNLTLEREVVPNVSVSVSYVGALARHLAAPIDVNYPVFGPGATTANVNARRPYLPGVIGPARVLSSVFNSDYHGLQVTAEKRGTHIQARAYYSFGKAMEDVDFQGGALPAMQDANDLGAERGRASSDHRHNLVLSGVWNVDYFDQASPFLKAVLNNWTLSAIVTVRSGDPLTISAGQDANLDGVGNDRANLVGDPALPGNRSENELIARWFNTAAFAVPAAGTDGTAGRNIIEGPGYKNVDLGLYRTFRVRRTALQLRVETTNAFNWVNFNNPGTTLNAASTFGKILTAKDRRRIQLGARFSF